VVLLQEPSACLSQETALTERLKHALDDSVADPERLHQQLFFALLWDLTELAAALGNSVEAATILELVSDYATAEYEAVPKPDLLLR
jgi:hypothetical protein